MAQGIFFFFLVNFRFQKYFFIIFGNRICTGNFYGSRNLWDKFWLKTFWAFCQTTFKEDSPTKMFGKIFCSRNLTNYHAKKFSRKNFPLNFRLQIFQGKVFVPKKFYTRFFGSKNFSKSIFKKFSRKNYENFWKRNFSEGIQGENLRLQIFLRIF